MRKKREPALLSAVDPENPPSAVIFGIAGETLTAVERDFFKAANPLGFILFARNCRDPEQVKALVQSLKDCLGRDAPILIDQEGGRVRRLKPPHWADIPSAKALGEAFGSDFQKGRKLVETMMETMARELADLGIQVDCAPVLDVLDPQTHDAIGDRAFSSDPDMVAALARIVSETFLKNGIIPVMKHIPGQGRATSDSHHDLPVVSASLKDLTDKDFKPFKELLSKAFADALWGMVAHVVYDQIDPNFPATCSRKMVYDVIRSPQGIGFQGLLLSDDIGMGALAAIGNFAQRTEQILRAGCDIVLHCSGDMGEMEQVATRAKKMTDQAVTRYNRTVSWFKPVV
jgi:beta-N-acetylhexosaminidase